MQRWMYKPSYCNWWKINMDALPLIFRNGHLFVEIEDKLWLLDTGAPSSFSEIADLVLAGKQFKLGKSYLGLSAAILSRSIGVQCAGLLGVDILQHFDHILDFPSRTLSVSTTVLEHSGQQLCLSAHLGIPILTAQIAGSDYRMCFDTGAQISYFQDESDEG